MPEDIKIAIRGVSVSRVREEDGERRRVQVLSEVSWDVVRDRFHIILGPSGAGKSTLLRLLNRLDDPDEGELLLDGQPYAELDVRALRRRVGMVFQVPSFPADVVSECLAYGPGVDREKREAPDATALLERANLSADFLHRRIDSLSVGERQRVALACMLANQPEVLLLDEPTSALDPAATRHLEEAFAELTHGGGLTAVMVSHDLAQAERLGGRALLLEGGRARAMGESGEVLEEARLLYARG